MLNPFHHLRLCVLVLLLCLGRRIDEVLSAPRGPGLDGPLQTYPAKGDPTENALWFRFTPNKQGPRDLVYISPEWEEIVRYCVHSLCQYSDEVRDLAQPEERGLLILVSSQNWTAGRSAVRKVVSPQVADGEDNDQAAKGSQPRNGGTEQAQALGQNHFRAWLNGRYPKSEQNAGILKQWNITEDGSPDGSIYYLRPHQAWHTRQSALAQDPHISLLTRQQDLNHRHRDMQFAYQHTLREQQQALLEKARAGTLFGPATSWLKDILDAQDHTSDAGQALSSSFRPASPALLNERWRALIAQSSYFLQFNRVPCGYCTLPQGPEGCMEYMNCLEAAEEGCQWFLADPMNEELLVEIQDRVSSHQQTQKSSLEAGRVVQAHKYEVLSRRAEGIQQEALQRSSQELRERLRARKQELERGQSCRNE